MFVNISNDGWYGEGGAPWQHLNQARMRAVENNRWLLRDTNTGITAVIDPLGRVVAEAPRNQRTQLQAAYSLEETTTFYTRHGDWFPLVCAIITLLGLLLRVIRPAGLAQPLSGGKSLFTTEARRHRESKSKATADFTDETRI